MDGRPKHGCIHISQNAEHFFINKTLFSSRILLCNVLSGLGPFRQRLTYAHNIHNTRVQVHMALFRKKMFEINFFVRQNVSKFAIFIEKENPPSFFRFSFLAT